MVGRMAEAKSSDPATPQKKNLERVLKVIWTGKATLESLKHFDH